MQKDAARDQVVPVPRPQPGLDYALPTIATGASPQEIVERLTMASRRGKLAGFDPRPRCGGLFAAAAHGHQFDSLIVADHDGANGRLSFRLVMLRKMPLVFGAILALTIWPGVYCMDELVSQLGFWRPEHPWLTYYWYLPLTVLPMPWMSRSVVRRSVRSAREHARETIETIANGIGGSVQEHR